MRIKSRVSKRLMFICVFLVLVTLAFLGWNIYQNNNIQVNEITVTSENLPDEFMGYKIAHISDLHNAEFGNNNEKLLSVIKDSSPDIIVITGDIVDSRQTDVQIARKFINNTSEIAPVYYVTGNHEARVSQENQIDNIKLNKNITVLHNKDIFLFKGESTIQLIGIDDPDFNRETDSVEYMKNELQGYSNNEYFKILLSHRPELFDVYAESNMNIVFSGHAHGGQFRLPFVGGIYAPHQGLFPQYDSGLYTMNNTNMIVSRGIGNSIFPFRINNPPEIIIVTLDS